jgi:hypothetical protein
LAALAFFSFSSFCFRPGPWCSFTNFVQLICELRTQRRFKVFTVALPDSMSSSAPWQPGCEDGRIPCGIQI